MICPWTNLSSETMKGTEKPWLMQWRVHYGCEVKWNDKGRITIQSVPGNLMAAQKGILNREYQYADDIIKTIIHSVEG